MEIISPWALVAWLYILGGYVIYQDMREADLYEEKMNDRFERVTYWTCIAGWPALVSIILAYAIAEKIKERRS